MAWIRILFLMVSTLHISLGNPTNRKQVLRPEDFYEKLKVEFPNLKFADPRCLSDRGRKGNCVSYPECRGEAVVMEGSCSDGFGVCCVGVLKNGTNTLKQRGSSKINGFHLSNPDFPLPTKQPEWNFDSFVESGVCQVRLDFDDLDLPKSTVFRVKLNGIPVLPTLSGNNTGQHFILDIRSSHMRPARLTFSVSGPPLPKKWNVRLENLWCTSATLAPAGCSQYHTSSAGRVRSLSVSSENPTPYAVCLRSPTATANLLSLKTVPSAAGCDSFMQVPAGMGLDGQAIPTKLCPGDDVRLTYKVFGPLVLYMISETGQRGVDVHYKL